MLKRLIILLAAVLPFLSNGTAQAEPPTAKIIDGTPVSESQFPHVARLTTGGSLLCTGTLVGPRHILTAAHCFFDNRNRQSVGNTDVVARLGGQQIQSAKVSIHPSYKARSSACVEGEIDAAVVELQSNAAGINPIPLAGSFVPVGTSLTLVGYGTQGNGQKGENGTVPPVGTVNFGTTVIEGYGDNPPKQNGNSSYFYWTFDPGEANTASGDSGGPAFFQAGNQTFIAGITCGGDGNAQIGTLSFNTRADIISAWVQSIVGNTPANVPPGFSKIRTLSGTVGAAFSFTVPASGTAPVTLTASGLPPGLAFDGSTISGTPAAAGNFTVRIDAQNPAGSATTDIKIVVSGFNAVLSLRKVLLQFDYNSRARDFLDITGKINVGKKFNPGGKSVIIQIGRFTKKFKLGNDGLSKGSGISYFDIEGPFQGKFFRKSTNTFYLTLERVAIFDELATLGFPASLNASEGQEVSLPLHVTINGIESSSTVTLVFSGRDARWRIKK